VFHEAAREAKNGKVRAPKRRRGHPFYEKRPATRVGSEMGGEKRTGRAKKRKKKGERNLQVGPRMGRAQKREEGGGGLTDKKLRASRKPLFLGVRGGWKKGSPEKLTES